MSSADDKNSNKDDEDLLKEDLFNENTGQISVGKDIFTKTSTDEVDKVGGISNIDEIKFLDNSKDSDNNKNINEESVSKTAFSPNLSKGDEKITIMEEKWSKNEVSTEKDLIPVKDNEKTKQEVEKDVSDDEIDEELTLRWDDDDNQNSGDSGKLDDTIESIESKDTESTESKSKSVTKTQSLEIETHVSEIETDNLLAKSPAAEINETETTTTATVETDMKDKNMELDDSELDISEVKLLEDSKSDIIPDSVKEINEDDLLKDDQADTEPVDITKLIDKNTKPEDIPSNSDIVNKPPKSSLTSDPAKKTELKKQSDIKVTKGKTDTNPESGENIEVNLNLSEENQETAMEASLITDDSMIEVKTDHGLKKPDVMLEIPTQELIDIDEVFDSPIGSKFDDSIDDDDDNMGELSNEEVITSDLIEKEGRTGDEISTDEVNDEVKATGDDASDEVATSDAKDTGTGDKNQEEAKIDDKFEKDVVINNKSDKLIVTKSKLDERNCDNIQNDGKIAKTIDSIADNVVQGENTKVSVDKGSKQPDITPSEVEKRNLEVADQIVEKETSNDDVEAGTSKATPTAVQSSVSNQMIPDSTNQVPEMSDSLGLLAESSRRSDGDDEDYDEFDSDHYVSEIESDTKQPDTKQTKSKCKDDQETETDTEMDIEESEIDIDEGNSNHVDETDVTQPKPKTGSPSTVKEVKSTPNQPETDKQKEQSDTKEEKEIKEDIKEKEEVKNRPDVMKQVSVSSRSSVTSNDDCIEQVFEMETVRISDDDDSMPASETQTPAEVTSDEKTTEDQGSTEKTVVDQPLGDDADEGNEKTGDKKVVLSEKTVDQSDISGEQVEMASEDIEKTDETEKTDDVEKTKESSPGIKKSPSKLRNLSIASVEHTSVVNIVDLEESSSEEDTQDQGSKLQKLLEQPKSSETLTSVNIPSDIEIMSSGGDITTDIVEGVITGVPKPPPQKLEDSTEIIDVRLNTSELTIKTASSNDQSQKLIIPETKIGEIPQVENKTSAPRLTLEIFNLDSDDDETPEQPKQPSPKPDTPPTPETETEQEPEKRKTRKCINDLCKNTTMLTAADAATALYYDASRKRRPMVCLTCAEAVVDRKKNLIAGIKNLTPLLKLDMTSASQDLVEILDSDSEDDEELPKDDDEKIGEKTAAFLEENLALVLNETWKMYDLDARLKETENELNAELKKIEEESNEIKEVLMKCQRDTDELRNELYASFEHRIENLSPILIFDTPSFGYIGPEVDLKVPSSVAEQSRLGCKRKLPPTEENPAKRAAIPLGYVPLNTGTKQEKAPVDDDKDISVVKLSAEAAPSDLPPPGMLTRPPLRVGMPVFAMKNAFGPWLKGKVIEIQPKVNTSSFTTCRVKFDHKTRNSNGKVLPARCIAYAEPADVRMTIGTRLIALFKDSNKRESYYSGVVAEIPNPVNNYRYLVFFDDGYAQYVAHPQTRLVCECSPLVWEEVHPFSREFVKEYLMAYPERPMVRLHEGQHLKTEWDGKWWSSRISKVDASLAQVVFMGDGRREWIYRGSTRLAPLYLELKAAERHRPRPLPRNKQLRSNMPYVEYTRSEEQGSKPQVQTTSTQTTTLQQQTEAEIRRQRAVAKKSVTQGAPPSHGPAPTAAPASAIDGVTSRVVYYTPKNAVKPHKYTVHKCSPKCKRKDVLSLKDLRTYNPLAKPLLSGWERQICRFKGQKEVMYRAPCGRRLRNMRELHHYLQITNSELPVDLFDFNHEMHCLAEFVLNKCLVGKKDLSHGKENVPVPCVNYYDESLPEFCSYNTERTPTSGVPLNLDPEFLCGCDCTDDCEDKSKCACWKMTLEGARTIGLEGPNIGYEYKRLPEPLPSGIYECNSRCKCKSTCLNRVAQHPLQLKLQVFKTLNRGWGIRALNDVPKGAFLCVYAGNLLTDATANLDGLNEGDEYLAELDYIEVVEQMKEGYEEDIPDADKKLDKMNVAKEDELEEPSSSSDEDEKPSRTDKEDDDFEPGYIGLRVTEFSKRLRRRARDKDKEAKKQEKDKKTKKEKSEEDCITISDDEEVREPSRFAAQPGMGGNDFVSKYKSVRTLFGEDEACYIMDAKVQGNIGRYLNHSCSPNVFVQNVFVDTHDPRFPWVAFFALSHIRAGMELTWNYNYDVGSVPGKVLYCYCEAPNCRGRLL